MSFALLPPSISLSWLTKHAPCPPVANNHYENPCLSMSCATNKHVRRGFVVDFEFDLPCVMFFSGPSYLAFKDDCNLLHLAPLMPCCFFVGSMEKDLVRTKNTPCALRALSCCAFHVSMLGFPLCFFSKKYVKIIQKIQQRRENTPPPHPSCMSIWKSLSSLFVCNASHGLLIEFMSQHMSRLFDDLVPTLTILFVDPNSIDTNCNGHDVVP